jgi:hypothetical protein
MLSSGFVNPQSGAQRIVYSGVPSPVTPASVVTASIASTTTFGTSMTFPIDLDLSTTPYLQLQLLQFQSYTFLGSQAQTVNATPASITTGQGNFYLPIPQNLVNLNKTEYTQDSLFKELGSFATGAGGAVLGGIAGVLTGHNPVATAAEGYGLGTGLNIAMTAAEVKNGLGLNSFRVLILKGPEFKQFKFSWIFSPRNPTEAQLLAKMLKTFEDAKTPSLIAGGLAWNYPYIFQPSFAAVDQQLMYKFKPSILTEFQVSYNPGGVNSWLRPLNGPGSGRMPNIIGVQMAFTEMELWKGGEFGSGLQNPNASPVGQALSTVANSVSNLFNGG